MMQLAVTVAGESRLFSPGQVVTIGRHPESTIVLTDPSIAPAHAFLSHERSGWVLHDRSNGATFVHDTRITSMPVRAQSLIAFGSPGGPQVSVLPVASENGFGNVPDLGRMSGNGNGAASAPTNTGGGVDTRSITESLASIAKSAPPLSVVLPLKAWWDSKDWQKGYPLLFLTFGIAPWFILHGVTETTSLSAVAWSFSAYFAALWALVMWALVRPGKVPMDLFAKVAIASAAIGVPIAVALEKNYGNTSSLWDWTVGVGFAEELAKALPVFVFMFLGQKKYTTRMYLYMGTVSGLAFGALEAVNYTKLAASGNPSATSFMTSVQWRLLTDGLFHACAAGISCYFIGLAVSNPRWRVQLIGFGLALVSVIHGINDRYSDGWLQVGVAAALLFVFIGYVMTGDKIEHEVAELAPQPEPAPAPVGVTARAS